MAGRASDKKIFGQGFFGHVKNQAKLGKMHQRFIVAPFSVLDTFNGMWQSRKRNWVAIGLKGEEGRREDEKSDDYGVSHRKSLNGFGRQLRKQYEAKEHGMEIEVEEAATGVSVFDPVLCEIMYHWYAMPGWTVLDPFAGGSTRGVVASVCGRKYVGVDVREAQVKANRQQAKDIGCEKDMMPVWLAGDSYQIKDVLAAGGYKKRFADLLFSCPPYYDREIYSSDNKDGSAHETYEEFLVWYKQIYTNALAHLKPNRFVVTVVGEIRDQKTGVCRNFVGDTVQMFKDLGLHYWNENILINSRGSLTLRTNRPFCQTRKIGRAHQTVLVFYYGDLQRLRETFEVPVDVLT